MMKQYAIIGLGRFGSSLATTLYEMGYDVLAIDKNEEKVQEIAEKVTYAVQADGSDENVLKSIGVRNVDVVIISIASDLQASVLATLHAKEFGIKNVYAKAKDAQHSKVLMKIGADRVFLPEKDMGVRVAHQLVSNNILEMIELDPDHSIIEINAFDNWQGRSVGELDFRAKYGINIIAIKKDRKLNLSPNANDIIENGDILVVIGDNNSVGNLQSND